MKNKLDFYIAFYERLALAGFQANVPSYDYDKKHLADICFKGYNIAHLTKTDHIIPNPHAEIPLGAMEQINYIARETAAGFTACTEKPYDETKHHEFSDGSYKLAEYNGMVLACGHHHLFGYLFYTFKFPNEIGQPDERGRQTFFAQSDAALDFAAKSGLVDERRLFTETELRIIFVSSIESRIAPGNEWCSDEIESLDGIIEKIEGIMPELGGYPVTAELKAVRDAEFTEGVEP